MSFPIVCFSSLAVLSAHLFCPKLCVAQPSVCPLPIPSPRLVTGVPEIVGEQFFLLQVYACFKIKYHMLSNTVLKNALTVKRPKSNLTPLAREMVFFGDHAENCIST